MIEKRGGNIFIGYMKKSSLGGSSMAIADSKFETWKNKLLDMSKRNRLLNYHNYVRRKNFKVVAPDLETL